MKPSPLAATALVWIALLPAAEAVDYKKDVLPIMKEHCWKCHSNENEVKGNLALDDLDEMRDYQVGKFSIIRPGKPVDSSFLEKMLHAMGDSDFFKRPGVDIKVALVAFAVMLTFGVLAGLFPALRALKIKAVDALRAE